MNICNLYIAPDERKFKLVLGLNVARKIRKDLREEITEAKEVKNNKAKIMGVEMVEIVKVVEVGEVSLKHEWMG